MADLDPLYKCIIIVLLEVNPLLYPSRYCFRRWQIYTMLLYYLHPVLTCERGAKTVVRVIDDVMLGER